MKIIYFDEIDSTNNYLLAQSASGVLPEYSTAWADFQTAGRGQQGNGWASDAGKNLLFSTILYPREVSLQSAFIITQWVSVAIIDALKNIVPNQPLAIKWPNDIYCANEKLAGILIENRTMEGKIAQCVVGVGLNVNQMTFPENIPNPTSLAKITNEQFDREALLKNILEELKRARTLLNTPTLQEKYRQNLYRREGFHAFVENVVDAQPINILREAPTDSFNAKIVDVMQDGRLVLQKENGENKTYHFKEIKYIIN